MGPFRREIEYFLAVAATLNISKASHQTGVQQSGLSKAIKSLEMELGQVLFYRLPRGLKLTPFGEVFRNNLRELQESWQDTFELAAEKLEGVIGRYSIGMHQAVAMTTLSKFLPQLHEQYPSLYIDVVMKRSPEVVSDVIGHRIDFGLVVNPERHPDLVISAFDRQFVGVYSKIKKGFSRIIYYHPDMISVVRILKKFKDYQQHAIQDYYVIAEIATQSSGLAVLPSRIARNYRELNLIGDKIFTSQTSLIYRHDLSKTPGFHAIKNAITQGLSEL